MIRFLKFSIAGGVNTLVDWVIFFMLKNFVFGIHGESLGKIGGAFAGIVSAFLFCILWVFKTEIDLHLNKCHSFADKVKLISFLFLKFVMIYSFGMLINYSIFMGLRFNNINEFYALIMASLGSFLFNYFFVKNTIFINRDDKYVLH